MDIGSRIREHRAAAGMKQDELAQACFVSRQTISNWERNNSTAWVSWINPQMIHMIH